MEPITAVTSAITAGHHAVSLLKGIAEAVKASGKAEALTDLIALQMEVLDILQKQQELVLENGTLQTRLKELEAELSQSRNVVFSDQAYWTLRDGKRHDGPFCQVCYDKDRKLIRLDQFGHVRSGYRMVCHVCNLAIE